MLEGELKGGGKFEHDQVVLSSVKALRYADYRLGLAFFFSPLELKKKKGKRFRFIFALSCEKSEKEQLKKTNCISFKKKKKKRGKKPHITGPGWWCGTGERNVKSLSFNVGFNLCFMLMGI